MNLAEQFAALDAVLMNTREYWQCTAFDFDELPWPELQAALNNLFERVTVPIMKYLLV